MKNIKTKSQGVIQQKEKAPPQKALLKPAYRLLAAENATLMEEQEQCRAELAAQNKELMLAANARQAIESITNLYNCVHSVFFTLSKDGLIIEANLYGEKMLCKELSEIKRSRFNFFVFCDTQPVFYLFLEKLFNSTTSETCEIACV